VKPKPKLWVLPQPLVYLLGHFDYFCVAVDGAPTFGGAIVLCDRFLNWLCVCSLVVVARL
jgi:hypothetical protein